MNIAETILYRVGKRLTHWFSPDRINTLRTQWLVGGILLLYFLTIAPAPNEENYLQLAKQFYDPTWIENAINLNEFAGTRLLYQYITGFLLSFLSFEQVVLLGRLALAVAFTFPLTKLYRTLELSNVAILLHLPILFLPYQSMFALSSIFLSVEAKTFAYFFVLYALVFFIQGRYAAMVAALIGASYFHILVGGYAFIYLGATVALFDPYPVRNRLLLLVVYGVCLLPFVWYLSTAVSAPILATPGVPAADWIYTYFRAPHHTAIFQSLRYFYRTHFYGVLMAAVTLGMSVALVPYLPRGEVKKLNQFVILSLAGTLVAVGVAFFDTTGQFVKYYPFRINALSTFVATLLVGYLLHGLIREHYAGWVSVGVVLLAAFFTLRALLPNAFLSYQYLFGANEAFDAMSAYIADHTERDAVILFIGGPIEHPIEMDGDFSLIRKTRRSQFVSYKIIPAELSKIPEWYERVQAKQAVYADLKRLPALAARYRVDYLLTTRDAAEVKNLPLRLVKTIPPYTLYRIKR